MEGNKLMRYLAYSLEIFILFMLQQTPGLFPEIFGARPVLLIPAAIMIAMLEPQMPAVAFGVYSGLMMDFGFGGILGINALIMVFLCYAVSTISQTVLRVNLGTAIITAVWTTAVFILLNWFFQYFLKGYTAPLYALTSRYFPRFCYTVLLSPIIFLINKGVLGLMRAQE